MERDGATSSLKTLCDVFVCTPTRIDPEVYSLWLQGNTYQESAKLLYDQEIVYRKKAVASDGLSENQLQTFIKRDVQDQYRNFQFFEKILQNPTYLQNIFYLPPEQHRKILSSYYDLDEAFIREFLGKKLKSKKKEIEDISEKLGKKQGVCRRQFENLRRVYKCVEQSESQSSVQPIFDLIRTNFLIPDELIRKYVFVLFCSFHRIETHRKRLNFLYYPDIEYIGMIIFQNWTNLSSLSLDKDFIDQIRDLKALLLSDKVLIEEYKKLVKAKLPADMTSKIDKNWQNVLKNLLNFGGTLSQPKEFKDFYVGLVEKVIEPFKKEMKLSNANCESLFQTLFTCFASIFESQATIRHKQRYNRAWERYLTCLRMCVSHLYPKMKETK